ncbi:hypothetical protein [Bacillus sp. 8A6]|uniref:Uncharacterized protein n=1 Tax=Bacillus safensis TaxID=561879 RepID=A0A5S9MDD2_BACIA|nr:hypothetical protein [Bacillus sp. 8A6]BBP90895.1 hypothetical protein BsIDN1_45130 [Bacillus safensis]
MKVKIIEGQNVDARINDCYHYLIKWWRKEINRESNLRESIDRGASDKRVEHRQPD